MIYIHLACLLFISIIFLHSNCYCCRCRIAGGLLVATSSVFCGLTNIVVFICLLFCCCCFVLLLLSLCLSLCTYLFLLSSSISWLFRSSLSRARARVFVCVGWIWLYHILRFKWITEMRCIAVHCEGRYLLQIIFRRHEKCENKS